MYSRMDRVKFFKLFKGCLPQILQGPFLNTLSYMTLRDNFQGNVGDILVSMT